MISLNNIKTFFELYNAIIIDFFPIFLNLELLNWEEGKVLGNKLRESIKLVIISHESMNPIIVCNENAIP